MDYYYSKGFNLFLWNYRGYGRSKGRPSFKNIKGDSIDIVKYLKTNFNLTLIGAHGESLGGAFAAHMAYKCNLDFVFVDRCFSSVDLIAKYNVHKYSQPLF